MSLAVIITASVLVLLLALVLWRRADQLRDRQVWRVLRRQAGSPHGIFDPSMVAELPDPARRYFLLTIAPGTPLLTATEIWMDGELGLGNQDDPKYRPMQAHQILAPPHGLVWQLKAGLISGSDGIAAGNSWTRFWLLNLIPLVRVSGPDHLRSAIGRVVAEGAFWTPASLLPGNGVRWEPVSEKTARAIVTRGKHTQYVDITILPDGRPLRVVIKRWSNANEDRVYRLQSFGGELSDFRRLGGYRLPFQVEGGNLIDTPDYFPFFKARVTRIRFPQLLSYPSKNHPPADKGTG